MILPLPSSIRTRCQLDMSGEEEEVTLISQSDIRLITRFYSWYARLRSQVDSSWHLDLTGEG